MVGRRLNPFLVGRQVRGEGDAVLWGAKTIMRPPINVMHVTGHKFRSDLSASFPGTALHRMEFSVRAGGVVATNYNK
jgi:hypothetical protein